MGNYPSGTSMKDMFQMERELLEMAFKGHIQCGCDENGIKYCPASPEEVRNTIREIYRNAEYYALEMAAAGRAMERVAKAHGVDFSGDQFKEYLTAFMEEKGK